MLEKTLESPFDSKEVQLVHPKGNQVWIFIGREMNEMSAGKDWRQEQKGATDDEMVGWCHQLNGREFY